MSAIEYTKMIPITFVSANRCLFATKAGSLLAPKAVPIKEIINFAPNLTDEVYRKIFGLLIACNDIFSGIAQMPSRRPIGKRFVTDRFVAFEFSDPEGSTNGYYER
jgi:hypothetical protein